MGYGTLTGYGTRTVSLRGSGRGCGTGSGYGSGMGRGIWFTPGWILGPPTPPFIESGLTAETREKSIC